METTNPQPSPVQTATVQAPPVQLATTDEKIAFLASVLGAAPFPQYQETSGEGETSSSPFSEAVWQWGLVNNLGPILFRDFRALVPKAYHHAIKAQYTRGQISDLLYSRCYQHIRQLLDEAGIDYCPLKGCYLAEHVYPDGALRTRADIDLLVRSSDAERAWNLLREKDGWTVMNENQTIEDNLAKDHHLPALWKVNVEMEIHIYPPGTSMDDARLEDFWRNHMLRTPNSHEHNLTDEMHAAVLLKHEARHFWERTVRLLTDFAYLMKRPGFSREKYIAYAKEINLTHPEVLFTAFPEIFGGGQEHCPKDLLFFRETLMNTQLNAVKRTFGSKTLKEQDRFSLGWLKRHRLFYTPGDLFTPFEHPTRWEKFCRSFKWNLNRHVSFFKNIIHPPKEIKEEEEFNNRLNKTLSAIGMNPDDLAHD